MFDDPACGVIMELCHKGRKALSASDHLEAKRLYALVAALENEFPEAAAELERLYPKDAKKGAD